MSKQIKYILVARTEAAGKYNPNAPQEGNEDNYGLICDVANPNGRIVFDAVADLGTMGLLMYVADGMGGHNAGEVASKIAVDTVAQAFSLGKITESMAATHESRSQYMEKIIREADKHIRKHAKQHSECEGMGSTLVMAWLVGDELSVSWCGDSRAYLYRPSEPPVIRMVSEDHSYVQELVQNNKIPYEATFGHPQGNIITRCLGGGSNHAEPESRMTKLLEGDIVLLCSDGLSGVLFDDDRLFDGQPISEENICDIITENYESPREAINALFDAAERQNWYDNVTAIVCKITAVAEKEDEDKVDGEKVDGEKENDKDEEAEAANTEKKKPKAFLIFLALIIALLAALGAVVIIKKIIQPAPEEDNTVVSTIRQNGDTICVNAVGDTFLFRIYDTSNVLLADSCCVGNRFLLSEMTGNDSIAKGKYRIVISDKSRADSSGAQIDTSIILGADGATH